MSSHYKPLPRLVEDLLRRRNMTLAQWCLEHSVTDTGSVFAECVRQGVMPPSLEQIKLALPSKKTVDLKKVVDEVHDKSEKLMTEREGKNGWKIIDRGSEVTPDGVEEKLYGISMPEAPKVEPTREPHKQHRNKSRTKGDDQPAQDASDSLSDKKDDNS